jgi:hypothetical protein
MMRRDYWHALFLAATCIVSRLLERLEKSGQIRRRGTLEPEQGEVDRRGPEDSPVSSAIHLDVLVDIGGNRFGSGKLGKADAPMT